MHRRTTTRALLGPALLLSLVILSSCTSEPSPTSPSPLPNALVTGSYKTSGSNALRTSNGLLADGEVFSCDALAHVQSRFGEPGWVNDDVVGFYVEFVGLPAATVSVQVYWDFENDPETSELVELEGDDFRRNGDVLSLEKTIEHTYTSVTSKTTYRVRLALRVPGHDGECVRVRSVEVKPPGPTCTLETGGAIPTLVALAVPAGSGRFVFPFAPGSSIPNGARPLSVSHNYVSVSKSPDDWSYDTCGNVMVENVRSFSANITGGTCGVVLVK